MTQLIDQYNRTVDYLRISITDRCNLRCQYCMPKGTVQLMKKENILKFDEIESIVKAAAALGIKKIRLTGGEPLVRNNIENLIRRIKCIQGIKEVTLTTNGTLLEKLAKQLKDAGLNRVNISLDTLNASRFEEITGFDQFEQVIAGIDQAIAVGLTPIKINTVMMKGINDSEINDFIAMAQAKDVTVRFIEFMPSGDKNQLQSHHYIPNSELIQMVEAQHQLIPLIEDKHSPSRTYQLKDTKGKIGFISPISNHFCAACNRLRLTAKGKLRPCLSSDQELNLIDAIGNEEQLKALFIKAIEKKPKNHQLMEHKDFFKGMSQIGG